jgi:hypothetical protein
MTDLTDVIQTAVPETTTTITTTEVSPITAVLEGIRLAVCDGRGLSSQLQVLILVCTPIYTHVYVSHNNI